MHYAELMRNPIGTMRTPYEALGDELMPAAEAVMKAWIGDHPQGKFRKYEYKLARFGLTEQGVRKLFERYLSRHEVEREG